MLMHLDAFLILLIQSIWNLFFCGTFHDLFQTRHTCTYLYMKPLLSGLMTHLDLELLNLKASLLSLVQYLP